MLEEVVKSDEAVSNHSLALDESLSAFFSKQAPRYTNIHPVSLA